MDLNLKNISLHLLKSLPVVILFNIILIICLTYTYFSDPKTLLQNSEYTQLISSKGILISNKELDQKTNGIHTTGLIIQQNNGTIDEITCDNKNAPYKTFSRRDWRRSKKKS